MGDAVISAPGASCKRFFSKIDAVFPLAAKIAASG